MQILLSLLLQLRILLHLDRGIGTVSGAHELHLSLTLGGRQQEY